MIHPKTFMLILDDVGPPLVLSPMVTPRLWNMIEDAQAHSLWVTPNCSATRCALFTRSWPHKTGIGTIVRHNDTVDAQAELMRLPWYGQGGSSMLIGKYHLCNSQNIEQHWQHSGWVDFDGHASNLGSGGQGGYWDWDRTTSDGTVRTTQYQPDVALEQVKLRLFQGQHDFICHSMALIHKPLHSPPGHPKADTDEAMRLQMMGRMDADAAEMIGLARQLGYRVMLFSDNGASTDAGGGKGTLYQTGISTPLYLWEFELPRPYRLCVVDLLTMVDGQLFGDAEPIGTRDTFYSESFTPNRVGEAAFQPGDPWQWAIRKQEWKLIYDNAEDRAELYDLIDDPGELRDLAAQEPGIVDRLGNLAAQLQGR